MIAATSSTERVTEVVLDPAERTGAGIDPAKVATAVNAIVEDGAVIVANAVEPEPLVRLAARMDEDLAILLGRPDRAENFAPGHVQQDPPAEAAFLWPALLCNPFATRVCREVLRQPLRLTAYSNNTNLPGSQDQAVHVDEGQLWPGLTTAHPAARLIVNIPLSSADETCGAIELWPGTHLETRICQHSGSPEEGVSLALSYVRAAKRAAVASEANRRVGLTVPEPLVAQRRAHRAPLRAATSLGSLLIRDPRVWHRGTAHQGGARRFMLALTYDPTWRRCAKPLELPTGARSLFDQARLDVCATFVDGPIDHLARHRPPANSPLRRADVSRSRAENG